MKIAIPIKTMPDGDTVYQLSEPYRGSDYVRVSLVARCLFGSNVDGEFRWGERGILDLVPEFNNPSRTHAGILKYAGFIIQHQLQFEWDNPTVEG